MFVEPDWLPVGPFRICCWPPLKEPCRLQSHSWVALLLISLGNDSSGTQDLRACCLQNSCLSAKSSGRDNGRWSTTTGRIVQKRHFPVPWVEAVVWKHGNVIINCGGVGSHLICYFFVTPHMRESRFCSTWLPSYKSGCTVWPESGKGIKCQRDYIGLWVLIDWPLSCYPAVLLLYQ